MYVCHRTLMMMMNINKKQNFSHILLATVLYYCHYITLQWGTEVQPEQLASVQNLRGKVKRSKMTASSHAEIVMTMMEMAPQRRSAEPAHNGFNSFFNGQTVCFFLGHCSMFARIQILRGKVKRSRWQGALMTISWWQWWKWPRRDAQPSPRTMGSIPF